MKLNINKKHKKADISKINLFKDRFLIPFLSMSIAISFMSGCNKTSKNEIPEPTESYTTSAEYTNNSNEQAEIIESAIEETTASLIDENGYVNIPEKYRYEVTNRADLDSKSPVTIDDLSKITRLSLSCNDSSDLSWLQYCTNLTELWVTIHNEEAYPALKDIQKAPNIESIMFASGFEFYISYRKENFDFIKDMPSLDSLSLIGYGILEDPNLFSNYKNLKKLYLSVREPFYPDYSKLTFLETLKISDHYSLLVNSGIEDYNKLVANGVNVCFDDEDSVKKEDILEEIQKADKKLNEIVKSFNLPNDASDKEKLDAILIYVLDNLTYDEELAEMQYSGQSVGFEGGTFYDDGYLTAFFEKDTAICGNYAALVTALANRVNLKTYIAGSETHGWNIVNVDGDNYYVDATWLDGKKTYHIDEYGVTTIITPQSKIQSGDTEDLNWYLEDPTKMGELDPTGSHNIINLPEYITIKPIEEEKEEIIEESTMPTEIVVEDIANKKFEISINGRVWIISGAALISIMLGLGVAIKIKKKRKNISTKQKEQQTYDNYDLWSDFSSDYTTSNRNRR